MRKQRHHEARHPPHLPMLCNWGDIMLQGTTVVINKVCQQSQAIRASEGLSRRARHLRRYFEEVGYILMCRFSQGIDTSPVPPRSWRAPMHTPPRDDPGKSLTVISVVARPHHRTEVDVCPPNPHPTHIHADVFQARRNSIPIPALRVHKLLQTRRSQHGEVTRPARHHFPSWVLSSIPARTLTHVFRNV
jgi:hypothetical protein